MLSVLLGISKPLLLSYPIRQLSRIRVCHDQWCHVRRVYFHIEDEQVAGARDLLGREVEASRLDGKISAKTVVMPSDVAPGPRTYIFPSSRTSTIASPTLCLFPWTSMTVPMMTPVASPLIVVA